MPSPVDFVQTVAKALVDMPDQVSSRWVESPDGDFVELTVNPDERGKIIGRRGRTIEALRVVASAAFGNGGAVGVEVAE